MRSPCFSFHDLQYVSDYYYQHLQVTDIVFLVLRFIVCHCEPNLIILCVGMAEDGIMHITLQKRGKGQTWASPILGQGQLDPYATDLEQKRLMLQRFQEEVSYSKNNSPCF